MLRAVLVLTAVMLATACSGDELPDRVPRDQVADGLAALFAGDHAADEDAGAATCFADALLEEVSLDRLQDAGVLDERHRVVADVPPLPPEVAADWADAQLACTDFVASSTDAQERLSKGRLDRPAYAACLGDTLSEDVVHAAVAASLAGEWDSPDLAALSEAQASCRREATPPDA